jgi:ATP-dependent DNA helicase DinG
VAQTPVAADDPVSGPEPRARRSAKETLGPDGPFASRAGYERRDEQLAMAEAVERALEDDTVLLCEAGTGVGKTLAYLVPAVLSGKRVVVSTATRALQDQIATRDLPAIARALGREPSVAIAKGLSNYVCLRRLAEARRATDLGAARRSLPVVAEWALASKTGDIAELTTVAEDDPVWADVTSSSETRVGASCAHFDECFVTRMRRELSAARIVLVNHHLFFADLALRAKAGPAAERAGVLPPYDAVIFDEAHRIEDVASAFFGARVSTAQIGALLRDALRAFGSLSEHDAARAVRLAEHAQGAAAAFFSALRRLGERLRAPETRLSRWRPEGEARGLGADGDGGAAGPTARVTLGHDALSRDEEQAHRELDDALDHLESFADDHAVSDAIEVVRRRARAIRDDLAAIVEPATHHVAWMETRGDHVALSASLVDVGGVFREHVVAKAGGVVLTSATLTTVPLGGAGEEAGPSGFAFLRRRLGLTQTHVPTDELELASPFDFDERALLYVPRDLPDVSHPSFLDRVAERAAELVRMVGGGAFMLTTSVRAMRALGAALSHKTGLDVLVQGDAPKSALLSRFREHGDAVLVATLSYWEGVDVPGDALRLVMFDKLPFAVPTDALVAARSRRLAEAGLDPFAAYSVPEAAITLKQGVGRLLRTKSDRGIVAVFDHRLVTRAYGQRILERLPVKGRTEELEEVAAFWARLSSQRAP